MSMLLGFVVWIILLGAVVSGVYAVTWWVWGWTFGQFLALHVVLAYGAVWVGAVAAAIVKALLNQDRMRESYLSPSHLDYLRRRQEFVKAGRDTDDFLQ